MKNCTWKRVEKHLPALSNLFFYGIGFYDEFVGLDHVYPEKFPNIPKYRSYLVVLEIREKELLKLRGGNKMTRGKPNWILLKECAEKLTREGKTPFTRRQLIDCVHEK